MEDEIVPGDGVVSAMAASTAGRSTRSRRTSPSSAARCRKTNAAKIVKVMDLAVKMGAPIVGL
jgi:acetyl-CoA carboxylase carboxyltransferase component